MAKSSKHPRSNGNSLPPTKRFDNTMVDDNLEELQHGVSEGNIIWHYFNGAFGQLTAVQYSATASAVPLKYDINIW